jgi:UDP-N-acetylmuramate dehydrogenase
MLKLISNTAITRIKKIRNIDVIESHDISNKSSLGLKCLAKIFLKIRTEQALFEIIKLLAEIKVKYLLLGKGSNLVLPQVITDPVIQLDFDLDTEELSELRESYSLGANMPLNIMTGKAIKYGLKGWEVFTGIPATLGGAIWMNAGTSLGEIAELITSVKILRASGLIEDYQVSACKDFSYRKNHFLSSGDIIISANIKHKGVDSGVPQQIISYLKKRSRSQPLTKKTCGCTFKNIALMPDGGTKPCVAGKIIDILGLKGLRHKDLVVSPVHGNFIENHGYATQEDFLEFVDIINSRIENAYGHKLEMEAIIFRNNSN